MLIVQEKETPTSRLGVLTQLFERLHAEDVVYCHWKGNVRLEAALSGEKDVDLLVDRKAVIALAGILSDLGFKRFAAIPQCAYPGIEDYLALDRRTGKLVHLHVHYQLTLTKKNAAGYRLPWEDLVLSTRKLDTEEEIHVADPNVELVLFIVRAALRLRALPALLLGRWRTAFQGSAQEEFCWLASRVDEEQLSSIAREKVGERAAVMLLALLAGEASANQLLAFRRSMWPRPRDYRTFGIWTALWRMWNREWALRLWRARNRYWQWTGPDRRVLPQGGLIVAFVGADG